MSEIIIGIDLGTTNSEVAVVENGKARVIDVDGDPILPSMVGLTEDGRLLVGKPARNSCICVRSSKRGSRRRPTNPRGRWRQGDGPHSTSRWTAAKSGTSSCSAICATVSI